MSTKGKVSKDYTGAVFHEVTVVDYVGQREGKGSVWRCICSCGEELFTQVYLLKSGQVKSCGHLRRVKSVLNLPLTSTRGRPVRHPLYAVWNNMINRCYNAKNRSFADYGGRGIKVCRRWHIYANFYDDNIGKWREGLEIDRENNHKGYYPENVRFVTRAVNASNTRATERARERRERVAEILLQKLRKGRHPVL